MLLIFLVSGKLPTSIFLDLSKAFDTQEHSIILHKLKCYGVDSIPLKWFKSYLEDRFQFVDYDGTKSNITSITTGVPQGSILGPLLFIIYINDIHEATENFKAILYADDTNLTSPLCYFSPSLTLNNCNVQQISNNINSELNDIFVWLCVNRLPSKKNGLFFTTIFTQFSSNAHPVLNLCSPSTRSYFQKFPCNTHLVHT